MTIEEGCVLTAFTGFLLTSFSEFHEWVEKEKGHPVFTHEFPALQDELRRRSTDRAMKIIATQTKGTP